LRSPVSTSVRLSLTPGPAPAPHRHGTGCGGPLTRLVVAVADHQPSTILVELAGVVLDLGRDLGLQRRCRAPSRTISSSNDPPTAAGACALDSDSSSTTLSTGVPSDNQRANAGPNQNHQTSRSSSRRCAPFTSPRRGPSTGSDHCSQSWAKSPRTPVPLGGIHDDRSWGGLGLVTAFLPALVPRSGWWCAGAGCWPFSGVGCGGVCGAVPRPG